MHVKEVITMYSCNRLQFRIVLLGLLLPAVLWAQPKSIKWGEVPRADLEMKTFPNDTNAAAVILGDVGNVYFNGRLEMILTRHRRIKIFSEAGYEWGNPTVQYSAKEPPQKVTDLEGQVFILDPDGTVRKIKLDETSIIDEEIDGNRRRLRLILPAFAPGVVVEYRYKIISPHNKLLPDKLLPDWEFQTSVPTRWSEFRAEIPALFMIAVSAAGAGSTAEELVMVAGKKLAANLLESENFGRQLVPSQILRAQTDSLVAELDQPEEKMRRIYDYVRTTMIWNGEHGIYANEKLDRIFQTRRSGGAEIALLLTAMLRGAGLDAHPVLISTRGHGKIIPNFSTLGQFNHVLTYVKVGDREYWLDATDHLRPYDLLPMAALNEVGWLVDAENPRWIEIPATGSFSNQTTVLAELAADGSITACFISSDAGYSGLFNRRQLRDKKIADYFRDVWFKDFAGARLDSFKINGEDSTPQPLVTEAYFSLADYARVAGDSICLNPILLGRIKENPFKRPERAFPIDFVYSSKLTYTLNLTLPDGYVIAELPQNIAFKLPNEAGHFRRLARVEGNNLQLTSQFVIRQPRFEPAEYQALREFYDRIVAAHAESIVLKRGAVSQSVVKE